MNGWMKKTGLAVLWRFDCLLAPTKAEIRSLSESLYRKTAHVPVIRGELESPCPRSRHLPLSQK